MLLIMILATAVLAMFSGLVATSNRRQIRRLERRVRSLGVVDAIIHHETTPERRCRDKSSLRSVKTILLALMALL